MIVHSLRKTISNALRGAVAVVLGITTASCSEPDPWKGVWNTDVEVVKGFKTPFEFQLYSGEGNTWKSRFELPEIMGMGEFSAVAINDSVRLEMGDGWLYKAVLAADKKTLTGIQSGPGQQPDTLTFTRRDLWLSESPARVTTDGKVERFWKYSPPVAENDGWKVSALSDSAIRRGELGIFFRGILERNEFKGLDAILVSHNGKLVLEEYFHLGARDRIHSIQSDTKSVNSLLFGIAQREGLIKDLDAPIQSFFPQYMDTMKSPHWPVTVRDALMMAASLDWKENNVSYSDPENDAILMNNASDMYHFVLSHQRKKGETPGTTFAYNSGLSVLLGGVILNATGMTAEEYAKKTLFAELNIKPHAWFTFHEQTHTGGGLLLRPRDLLKIGQLVLDSGRWNEHQVVPRSWIRESTIFRLRTSESNPDEGYGYQWWRSTMKTGQTRHPYIYASGYGGQFVWIVPDLNLVVVALHHFADQKTGRATITTREVEEKILPMISR